MSNIIPPMLSSSPPPMDDAMEDDEDDEFGDFAAADDLSYNAADAPETPSKSPVISSTFWEEEVKQEDLTKHSSICNGMDEERVVVGQDNTSQDSVVSGTTDSGLCSASQNSGGASPSPVPPELGDREESSGSDDTLVKSVDTCALTSANCGDDFQSVSESVQTFRTSPSKQLARENTDSDDFGDFESVAVTEQFAVFESSVTNRDPGNWAAAKQPTTTPVADDDDDDNEDDFDEFETAVGCVGLDHKELLQKLTTLVSTLFPLTDVDVVEVNVPPLADSLATVWLKLRDVESSHALSYQWSGSTANKSLLTSLGIDSRNILFGPRWNTSVPRFAANLGFSPLEPVRASRSSPTPQEPAKETCTVEAQVQTSTEDAVVPAAQFDWNGSGLVNPLDSAETSTSDALVRQILASSQSAPVARSRQGLSAEAVKVLDELPDLSFLSAKLLMFPVRGTSP